MRVVLLTLYLLFAVSAARADFSAFDSEQFKTAQEQGKSILIDVHATWCSTCKIQSKRIGELAVTKEFSDYVLFKINVDNTKLKQRFNVNSRGTLIVFKGSEEKGRIVLVTNKEAIKGLMQKAL